MTDLRQVVALALAGAAEARFRRHTGGAAVIGGTTANMTAWQEYADAVLAALSASIGEDVVEAAVQHVIASRYVDIAQMPEGSPGWAAVQSVRRDIATAAPIIALAARDATLEEAASRIRALMQSWEDFDDYYAMRDAANEAVGEVLALKAAQANG